MILPLAQSLSRNRGSRPKCLSPWSLPSDKEERSKAHGHTPRSGADLHLEGTLMHLHVHSMQRGQPEKDRRSRTCWAATSLLCFLVRDPQPTIGNKRSIKPQDSRSGCLTLCAWPGGETEAPAGERQRSPPPCSSLAIVSLDKNQPCLSPMFQFRFLLSLRSKVAQSGTPKSQVHGLN